jgi:hypothetical protein
MQEFLNPKSMATPGVAGTLMMFLVNGLTHPFPELSARYTALAISFLIGTFVFFSQELKDSNSFAKGTLWIVNSLIVFVIGFGTTYLGASADVQASLPSIVTSAFAQEKPKAAAEQPLKAAGPADAGKLQKQLHDAKSENVKLKEQVRELQRKEGAEQPKKDSVFFRRW